MCAMLSLTDICMLSCQQLDFINLFQMIFINAKWSKTAQFIAVYHRSFFCITDFNVFISAAFFSSFDLFEMWRAVFDVACRFWCGFYWISFALLIKQLIFCRSSILVSIFVSMFVLYLHLVLLCRHLRPNFSYCLPTKKFEWRRNNNGCSDRSKSLTGIALRSDSVGSKWIPWVRKDTRQ